MRYVSIDVETTGTIPNFHEIVEFAAIIEDTEEPEVLVEDLPTLRVLFRKVEWRNLTTYCAKLHVKLWEEIEARRKEKPFNYSHVVLGNMRFEDYKSFLINNNMIDIVQDTQTHLRTVFADWLRVHHFGKGDAGHVRPKITAAGKNFSGFDRLFLEAPEDVRLQEEVDIKHRVIDPAIFFWNPKDDEALPNTDECLKRAGISKRTDHTAVSDARNVIELMRKCRKYLC